MIDVNSGRILDGSAVYQALIDPITRQLDVIPKRTDYRIVNSSRPGGDVLHLRSDSYTRLKANTLTDLLDIKHPIILAPMANVSGSELAYAVGQAGALGLIGGGYADRTWLAEQLTLLPESVAQDLASANMGVGFITWRLSHDQSALDLALSHRPKAVMLSFGEIAPYVEAIKSAGALVIAQIQTRAQAQIAQQQGADILVAQGAEAGGHGAGRGSLALIPSVKDIANVPVVAAGGIADGRGLAAAMMLGASGVLIGSRFHACTEALSSDSLKQAIVDGCGDDTLQSSIYDHLRGYDWQGRWRLRSLKNAMTDQWYGNEESLVNDIDRQRARFLTSVQEQDFSVAPVIVGEAVDMIDSVEPADRIIRKLVSDASATLGAAAGLVAD